LQRIEPPGAELASFDVTADERHGLDAAQLLITAFIAGNADAANLFKRFAYG
jgi:hypothetical protein